MPNRILREGILTSPNVARLGWAEEVFYRRLMSVVDDFGRYYARPALLSACHEPAKRQAKKALDRNNHMGKIVSVKPASMTNRNHLGFGFPGRNPLAGRRKVENPSGFFVCRTWGAVE